MFLIIKDDTRLQNLIGNEAYFKHQILSYLNRITLNVLFQAHCIVFYSLVYNTHHLKLVSVLHNYTNYTPTLKSGVYYFSSVHPSVRLSIHLSARNQYFLSHFSQQPCIMATSNLVWCFS